MAKGGNVKEGNVKGNFFLLTDVHPTVKRMKEGGECNEARYL